VGIEQEKKYMTRSKKTVVADEGLAGPARRAVKGMKSAGPGRDKQNPRKQTNRKIEAWCEGKSGSYK
jgi:hypothetical protein